jgi:hypothetical protein
LLATCLTGSVSAENFDGSKPLLCAALEVFECEPAEQCSKGTIESVDILQFVAFNFKEKTISATLPDNTEKTAKIESQTVMDGKLVLQGAQKGRGWSMVIAEDTGKMALTASDDQAGFIVFGACTPK